MHKMRPYLSLINKIALYNILHINKNNLICVKSNLIFCYLSFYIIITHNIIIDYIAKKVIS